MNDVTRLLSALGRAISAQFRHGTSAPAADVPPSMPAGLADPVEPDPEAIASLDVIRAELDLQRESLTKRSAKVDTQAGLVLAAAGVIISSRAAQVTLAALLAQGAALVAGVLAALAVRTRTGGELSPRGLRKHYVNQPEAVTKLFALDTLLQVHENDEGQLVQKARWLRWAFATLALSVLLAVAGSIVNYANKENSDGSHPAPDVHASVGPSPSSGPVVVSPGPSTQPSPVPTGP